MLAESPRPLDSRKLRDGATKLVAQATGNKPRDDSVYTELSKLVAKGLVVPDGANEHGALYTVVEKGGPESPTLR